MYMAFTDNKRALIRYHQSFLFFYVSITFVLYAAKRS